MNIEWDFSHKNLLGINVYHFSGTYSWQDSSASRLSRSAASIKPPSCGILSHASSKLYQKLAKSHSAGHPKDLVVCIGFLATSPLPDPSPPNICMLPLLPQYIPSPNETSPCLSFA